MNQELDMNKSALFSRAWAIARSAAVRFGGSAKTYFAASLRLAYRARKPLCGIVAAVTFPRMFLRVLSSPVQARIFAANSSRPEYSTVDRTTEPFGNGGVIRWLALRHRLIDKTWV